MIPASIAMFVLGGAFGLWFGAILTLEVYNKTVFNSKESPFPSKTLLQRGRAAVAALLKLGRRHRNSDC